MKCLWALCLLNLLVLFEMCSSDKHTFGGAINGGDRIFYKKVIDDTNDVPKNYTIIFKHISAKISPLLSYFEIDVSANSTGKIQVTNEMKNIDATVSVFNALNVTATISMFGFGASLMSALRGWPYTKDDYSTKGYTIVYMKNATVSDTPKQFSRNSIGKRQSGDELIHFESRNVTNASRFPSRAFEYSGDDWITYVGFSFNSPTAMALVNTTYITDKEFSTVAYDMNTEHFVANISIYGFKRGFKPYGYFNILGDGML